MKGEHESSPHGAPYWWDWYATPSPPPKVKRKPPKGSEIINWWGIAYEDETGCLSKNTVVLITDVHMYGFSISKNKWIRISNKPIPNYRAISGGMYMEAYGQTDEEKKKLTNGKPLSIAVNPDWQTADNLFLAVIPGNGGNAHFGASMAGTSIYISDGDPSSDFIVVNEDIGGFMATFKGKLALLNPNGADHRSQARFIMAPGMDYWEENSTATGSDGLGTGKLKWVTSEWRNFYFVRYPKRSFGKCHFRLV